MRLCLYTQCDYKHCFWLSVLVIMSNAVFLLLSTQRFIMAWHSRIDPRTKLKTIFTYAQSRIIGSNAVEKVEVISHNSDHGLNAEYPAQPKELALEVLPGAQPIQMHDLQMVEWTKNPAAVDSN